MKERGEKEVSNNTGGTFCEGMMNKEKKQKRKNTKHEALRLKHEKYRDASVTSVINATNMINVCEQGMCVCV